VCDGVIAASLGQGAPSAVKQVEAPLQGLGNESVRTRQRPRERGIMTCRPYVFT